MIWTKTGAGRHEIQARALVEERARRNRLLLIDGTRSEAVLQSSLTGIGIDDFKALEAMALIAPVAQRTLDQIRDRRGEAAATAARQTLYGA